LHRRSRFRQTGLVIVFLLERQQQKLGHDVGREFDIERPRLRRHVMHVLPNPMIRGHGFVEVGALHGLDRRHDFGPSETKGRSARTAVPVTLSLSTSSKAALKAAKS
jgi:hypothetical protein